MRFDKHIRAASASALGVFLLSALASNMLLRLFFSLLQGPQETGFEKDIISFNSLLLISGLFGLMIAIVCFRPILSWIRERGLPGFIAPPDPFEGKYIRVALVASPQGSAPREVYSQWLPAHHIRTLMKGPLGKKLTLGNKAGERLSILRCLSPADEGEDETFLVVHRKGRRVSYNMELPAGKRGTLETDEERNYATCWYPLSFVGCDDTTPGGWLKFGGEVRIMRLAFTD
jgi:hypothetical protein